MTRDPSAAETTAPMTRPGVLVGTPAYMSPEQVDGKPADARSDVFSVGTLLYEMLAGQRPFRGDSPVSLLSAILRDSPPPLRSLRPDVPRYLQRVVERCLAKNPDERYASAAELLLDLTRVPRAGQSARVRVARGPAPASVRRASGASPPSPSFPSWLGLGAGRPRTLGAKRRPAGDRAARRQRTTTTRPTGSRSRRSPCLPGDPQLDRFWKDRCFRLSLRTNPPGADVFVKSYGASEGEWKSVGRTPLEGVRMPFDMLRWRITKEGFEPVEATSDPSRSVTLPRLHARPAWAPCPRAWCGSPADTSSSATILRVKLDDFWLDRYEVTNRQYKEFVDQGGYREAEYWKQPFVKEGRRPLAGGRRWRSSAMPPGGRGRRPGRPGRTPTARASIRWGE